MGDGFTYTNLLAYFCLIPFEWVVDNVFLNIVQRLVISDDMVICFWRGTEAHRHLSGDR